jgi:ABC-type uncharacterized transport system involved in gliding motility auxiliary subunit
MSNASPTGGGLRASLGGYTAITGVVALIAAVIAGFIFVLLPALADTARLLLGVALLFFVVFVVGAFDEVRSALMARQTKYGTNAVLMVLAFAAIMGVVNFLAAQYSIRVDTTASKQFTLSQHTQNILRGLKQPVTVTGFFSRANPQAGAVQEQVESLLKEYQNISGQLNYRFVDPVESPEIARQYQVQSDGVIVFEQSGRRQQVAGIDEQAFTGGILKVIGLERLKVYVLTGHGERDLASREEQGFARVAQALDAENYEVNPLNLTTNPQVPADARLLIVAAPSNPLLDAEVRAIDDYLVKGGKALFLLDPNPRPEIAGLLVKWGVKVTPGQVVDPAASVPNLPGGVLAQRERYLPSPITTYLDLTLYPGAAGLVTDGIPEADRDHVVLQPLAVTSGQAFSVGDANRTTFQEGDIRGPFALAFTVQADQPIGQRPSRGGQAVESLPTRIAVFGDSDFASNRFFYSVGSNGDLFVNTVNWLTAQEALISIRSVPPEFRRLVITQAQMNLIMVSSVVFWPGLLLVAAGFVWWRRR